MRGRRPRSAGVGESARKVPGGFAIMDYPELEDGPDENTARLGAVRLGTARIPTHQCKMGEIPRDKGRRQIAMKTTPNDHAAALAAALTQVGHQTMRRKDTLHVHRQRLQEIKMRPRGLNGSQKKLELAAEAFVAQRERARYRTVPSRNANHVSANC